MNWFTLMVFLMALASPELQAGEPCAATDRDRARWTHGDMMSWKIALDAYRTDNGRFPEAKTLEELRAAVVPKYMMQAPMKDAWGVAYVFEPNPVDGYTIASAGADGKFARETWSAKGKSPSYDDDAVLTGAGRFLTRYWDLSK